MQRCEAYVVVSVERKARGKKSLYFRDLAVFGGTVKALLLEPVVGLREAIHDA